jgi:hypothetical protein
MNKTTQTLLIIGLSGVAVYLLWKNYGPKPIASVTPTPTPTPEPAPNPCGNMATCSDGITCYDPNVNYLIDPCAKKKKLEKVVLSS